MNNNARALLENAEKYGLIEALEPFGRNIKIRIPYSVAFSKVPIDNLELSVRSRNGLMRAGLDTVDIGAVKFNRFVYKKCSLPE